MNEDFFRFFCCLLHQSFHQGSHLIHTWSCHNIYHNQNPLPSLFLNHFWKTQNFGLDLTDFNLERAVEFQQLKWNECKTHDFWNLLKCIKIWSLHTFLTLSFQPPKLWGLDLTDFILEIRNHRVFQSSFKDFFQVPFRLVSSGQTMTPLTRS